MLGPVEDAPPAHVLPPWCSLPSILPCAHFSSRGQAQGRMSHKLGLAEVGRPLGLELDVGRRLILGADGGQPDLGDAEAVLGQRLREEVDVGLVVDVELGRGSEEI